MRDYCSLLDVPRNTSSEEIRRAYRQLALKWHPDKNAGNKAEDQARSNKISETYEVLSDESKRRHYDLHGRGGQQTGHHKNFARSRDANANTTGGAFPFAYLGPDALSREFFGSSDTYRDLFCGMHGGQCGLAVLTGGFTAYQQNFGSTARPEFIDLENLLFAPHLPASGVGGNSAGLVAMPTQQVSSLRNINSNRIETRTSMGDDIKNMLCFEDDQLISHAVEGAVLEMTEEASPGPSRDVPHCRQRRDAPDFFALSQFGGCVPAQGLEQRRLDAKPMHQNPQRQQGERRLPVARKHTTDTPSCATSSHCSRQKSRGRKI
ncbi:hypothetical protein HPB50_013494 [Hyalomma asiaticum]|uniref:Uncharacterized protein n=1 Tax=Hyalomma asiaticum TaxID=266040 RepID=A0ACB7SCG7_HYAAI|nr:hypothetical protein HPB50_013494 [Hyalomma asiaticum]